MRSSYLQFLEYYKILINQADLRLIQLSSLEDTLIYHPSSDNIEKVINDELSEIKRFETYLLDKVPLFLKHEIKVSSLRAINWLCKNNVVNSDQAWGPAVGRESRVGNTVEVCMGLISWQQLLSEDVDDVEILQNIFSRVNASLQWLVKQQDVSGGFFSSTGGNMSAHNAGMFLWLVCSLNEKDLREVPVDWNLVISKVVEWFQTNRFHIRSYDFFGADESNANRVFSSIWVLRSLVAYTKSSLFDINSQWSRHVLEKEIPRFLKAVQIDPRQSPKSEYLAGYNIIDTRPSPTIVAMLLILVSEARMADMNLGDEIDKFISIGIEYLYETLGIPILCLWDDEIEGYIQYSFKGRTSTTRSWFHIASAWSLVALSLNRRYLNQHQYLLLMRAIITLLSRQTDEGFFPLLKDDLGRSGSVFGTALHLYAFGSAMPFDENV